MAKYRNSDINNLSVWFNLQPEAIVLFQKLKILPRDLRAFDYSKLLKDVRKIWDDKDFLRISIAKLSTASRHTILSRKRDNLPEWQIYVRNCCEQLYSQGVSSEETTTRMQEILEEIGKSFSLSTTDAVKKRVHSIRRSVFMMYYRKRGKTEDI